MLNFIRRIEPYHYAIGRRLRLGLIPQGSCWRFKFERERFSTGTVYGFWRFFLAIQHPENTSCET